MALRFNGSTGYLKLNAALRTSLPLSVVVYAGGSGPSGDGHVWSQGNAGSGTGFRLYTDSFGGNAYASDSDGSSWNAVKSGTWNTGSFRLFACVFASTTSRKVYHGTATPGTDTATAAAHISADTLFAIGCAIFNDSPSSFMAMDAAEVHFYSTALSDADITSMLGGTKPEDIAGWVDGWQLKNTTDLTSMGGTRTLTLNGGVTNSALTHPISRVSAPNAPTTPTTTSITATGATAGWTDASSDETGFDVEIEANASGSWSAASGATNPTAANATSFTITGLTSGYTYRWRVRAKGSSVDSAWLTSDPFYPGTIRPVSDVTVTGWSVTGAATHAAALNENTASDSEYVTSPTLSGTPSTEILALDKTLAAGSYSWQVRASVSSGSGYVKLRLLNGSNVEQGASSDQAITTTPTTYTLPITTTGSATRLQIEVWQ